LQQSAKRTNEVLKRWVFERSSVVLYRNVFFENSTEMNEVEHDELILSVNGCPSAGHIYFDGPHGSAGGRVGLLSFLPRRLPYRWHWQVGCELSLCCKFLENSPPLSNEQVENDKEAILSISDPILMNLMTNLSREVQRHDIFSSGILEGICLQLSSTFERFRWTRSASEPLRNRFSADMDLVFKTVDGRRSTPPLHELACKLGFSPRHFARLFEKFSGMNYASFVGLKRAELAKDMLSNSSRPIKAIGFELGFDDAASFSRAFRKWAGCSPSVYRARDR
jgi:AraC-like DNA-binding protein